MRRDFKMFQDILIMPHDNELHVYSYFNRDLLHIVKLNEKIQIESYDEIVFLSGELKQNNITKQLHLIDRNGFVCPIEFEKVYKKIWLIKDESMFNKF